MMNKFIFSVLAVMLLASCANKFSIQKRRYNKGFHVTALKGNGAKENKENTTVKKKSAEPELAVTEIVLPQTTLSEKVVKSVTAENHSSHLTKGRNSVKPQPVALASRDKNPLDLKQNYRVIPADLEKTAEKSVTKGKGNADANLVVMVILSLFLILCLIAVYLHDGKSITMNFWIDLLLHLTLIGAIIFALLVVLDVVDLS